MKQIIDKILEEVDPDIKEIMLMRNIDTGYYNWQLLDDPVRCIFEWQKLRNYKKGI